MVVAQAGQGMPGVLYRLEDSLTIGAAMLDDRRIREIAQEVATDKLTSANKGTGSSKGGPLDKAARDKRGIVLKPEFARIVVDAILEVANSVRIGSTSSARPVASSAK